MATNTGNFGELLEPGLRDIYGLTYKQYKEEYSKVFELKNSTKQTEHTLSMTGLGLMPAKNQGQAVSYDDPIQGYKQSLTHVSYGLGFIVTLEMYEDDLYKKINTMPALLARSGVHTTEITAANVLNRAFNSSYTGADSKEMCATDHTLIGGGTFANELATSSDLSMTSYEQALIDIQGLVDDRGLLLAAVPSKLVIPPQLEWTTKQLLKSEKDPESANNAINPAQGTVDYTVLHRLTDPDAWFIQTDVPNGLVFYWRRRPAMSKDNDHDTDNAKFKATMRFVCGWDDPRSIFGSPGA